MGFGALYDFFNDQIICTCMEQHGESSRQPQTKQLASRTGPQGAGAARVSAVIGKNRTESWPTQTPQLKVVLKDCTALVLSLIILSSYKGDQFICIRKDNHNESCR